MVVAVETKRQRLERLRAKLELERASFESTWRELGQYYMPMRPKFSVTDHNRGERLNQDILDSTGTQAANTLRSGMMAGITSPARPWKRLTTPDPSLSEVGPVKDWLHVVDQRMDTVFSRSNLYDALQEMYLDLVIFGTAAMIVEEDFFSTIHATTFPIGTYSIANDRRRRPNVCARLMRMTVRQLIEEFAELDAKGNIVNRDNLSQHVMDLWERDGGDREAWIDVSHVIYPNDQYSEGRHEAKYKKYASCYYEVGTSSAAQGNYIASDAAIEDGKFLRESGYDNFPVIVLRWSVSGSDVYATDCPGMTALGDVKQLQIMEKRGAQALEKHVNPPLNVPQELMNAAISILPGARNHVPDGQHRNGVRPVHEVKPALADIEAKEEQVRRRINDTFFVQLFLMFANVEREMTAREVAERQQEKLLVLGPVLQRLDRDGLKPIIDITFSIMERQGQFEDLETPEELVGVELKIEYISILSQAQKAIGIEGLHQILELYINLVSAKADPEALLKIDLAQLIDEVATMLGVPPRVIRSDEAVAELAAQAQKQQQAMAMAEQAQNVTGAVKDLSESSLEGDTALSQLLNMANAGRLAA